MKFPREEIKKIAIFRALQLGDMLCSIPAIRALRRCYPNAEINLLGLPWAKSLIERFPSYFDNFIHFPGYPGLPEQEFVASKFSIFLQEMIAGRYDLVLQMQGNGSIVNPMIELFGARYTAGFCKDGDYCKNEEQFLKYPEGIPEIERHLSLMNFLDIPSQGTDLEFPIRETDRQELKDAGLQFQKGSYACIHPGSRGSWRQWPPSHFAMSADVCYEKGLKVVVTGTKDEADIVNHVLELMKHKGINASGKTSLGAVAALIENAALLVSNCTGVSHVAAACKTRSIVISLDGEPERWAPLNKQLHRTIDWLKQPDYKMVEHQLEELIAERSL